MYKKEKVEFLLDPEDSAAVYEEKGRQVMAAEKANADGGGLTAALEAMTSGMDRATQLYFASGVCSQCTLSAVSLSLGDGDGRTESNRSVEPREMISVFHRIVTYPEPTVSLYSEISNFIVAANGFRRFGHSSGRLESGYNVPMGAA